MTINYKLKYLKYKKKYKQMKGGSPFINLQEVIIEKLQILNSYQLYNSLLIAYDNELNLLIGATNSDNNDYARFKNSKYSLFIDTADYILEREHKMYCLKLSDFKGFHNYILFNSIHFDLGVSYFCYIDQYINLIYNLKRNSSMVFELVNQRNLNIYMISGDKYINIITSNSINEEQFIEKYNIYNINHVTKIIQINYDPIKYPKLSGEYSLSVRKYKVDELYFFNSYATWFSNRHPGEFRAIVKSYTYMNYTYPVDIRQNITESNNLVETWYDEVNDVCNNLMNKREKDRYLSVKNLTDSHIKYLLDRKTNPSYTEDEKTDIKNIFKTVHYFLEITRL
jgi:hypothetical protein